MLRHSNTLTDLFSTAQKGGQPQIFCPGCGTPMTLRRPGGARPVLGERTRESLNVHLSCFRYGWLTWIADSLSQKNDGVEPRAPLPDVTIDKTRIKALAGDLVEHEWYHVIAEGCRRDNGYDKVGLLIDLLSPGDIRKQILEKVKALHKLPQVTSDGKLDLARGTNSTAEDIAAIIQYVLLPIEKSDLFVATLNIVLDEPRASQWIQRLRRDALKSRKPTQHDAGAQSDADAGGDHPIGDGDVEVSPVDVITSLSALCPPRSQYLMEYLRLLAATVHDAKYFSEEVFGKLGEECKKGVGGETLDAEVVRVRIINRCERAAFLVALLLMHKTDAGKIQMKRHFSPLGRLPSGNGEYRLPETTVITYDSARLLMQSLEVSVADILGLGRSYSEILKTLQVPPSDGQTENSHEWFLRVIGNEQIKELFCGVFGFGCQGPPPQFPTYKNENGGRSSEHTRDADVADVCGWTPKSEETFSILLIGSPGCGKSNAFLSGMAKFATAIARKSGFLCSFSALSDMLLDRIKTAFARSNEPVRTEISTYHSIEFTLEEETGSRKLHFVVIDVAGELATQRLREGESSTLVRQTLRSADVVVAFLDIGIDPELAAKIEVGPQRDRLNALIDCREKAREPRKDEVGQTYGGASSVADVSQWQFLDSIVAECKRDRRSKAEMPDLILVIPKADLYADPEERFANNRSDADTSPHIMQAVFRSAKRRNTLFIQKTGNAADDSKLKWLTSSGVTYKHIATDKLPVAGYVSAVISEMAALSTDCKSALLNIGRLVDADEPLGQDAQNCNDQMEALISGLEREFYSVHLLPVSAQGKPAKTDGDWQRSEEVAEQENDRDIPNEQDHGEQEPVAALVEEPRPTGAVLRGKLGHPQKFSEFLILGPAMMLVKKRWIDPDVQTLQTSSDTAPTVNVNDPQRPDSHSRKTGGKSSADGNSSSSPRQSPPRHTNRPD